MTPSVRIPIPWPDRLADSRFRAYRSCPQCDWQVRMTGDDEADVERFLDQVLNTHVVERHGPEGKENA